MVDRPRFSVILNCFNAELYIAEAINSVLRQTESNFELLIWDNCSTDKTLQKIKCFSDERIVLLQAEFHTSLGKARASALEYARGDYIGFIDSDDIWLPTKLEKQWASLQNINIGLVYADTIVFNNTGEQKLFSSQFKLKSQPTVDFLAINYSISLESAVFRREVIQAHHITFNPLYSAIEEYDFFLQIASVSSVAYIPEPLSKWRVHSESITFAKRFQFIVEEKIFLRSELAVGMLSAPTINELTKRRLQKLWFYALNTRGRRRAVQVINAGNLSFKSRGKLLFLTMIGPRWMEVLLGLFRHRVRPS